MKDNNSSFKNLFLVWRKMNLILVLGKGVHIAKD